MGAGGIDELLARVSYHAVTRYVQRVLGHPPIASDADGTRPCAEAHCAAAGTTIAAIRAAILTPPVAAGLIAGATSVRTAAFTAALAPCVEGYGVVVTIHVTTRGHASRILGRREGHRIAAGIRRRAKRRPSKSVRSREVAEA